MLKPGRSPNKIISFLQPQLSLVFSMSVKIGSIWESLLRSDNTALREFLQFKRVLNRWEQSEKKTSPPFKTFPASFAGSRTVLKLEMGSVQRSPHWGLQGWQAQGGRSWPAWRGGSWPTWGGGRWPSWGGGRNGRLGTVGWRHAFEF